jgi:cupin fold WbuC family metalloprotein
MENDTSGKPFPLALRAPGGDQAAIDAELVDNVVRMSRVSPRGRIIQRLHQEDGDPLQRMLNGMQPESYVRPHRHTDPPRAESIVVMRGAIGFVAFTESGEVSRTLRAGPGEGVDIRPGVLHTFFALEPNTVVFECKAGPYSPITDKDLAAWAPSEGTPEASAYLAHLHAKATHR